MADELASDVIRSWETLKGNRGTFETHWQQCADYMLPDRADYLVTRAPGQKRLTRVFDGTPIWALQQFAAGMHSFLTSPYLQWFSMQADDDRLNKLLPVRLWLDDAARIMYNIFNGPRHNFAAQSQELYQDIGNIGTAVMAVLEGRTRNVLFSARHLKECCIFENEEDRIDGLVRRWEWTPRQAVQQWGKAAGEKILKAYEAKPDGQKYAFYHRVQPRKERDISRVDRLNKPYQSVYVSEADKTVIDEGGFDEFPYLCPRFSKVTGELYGRGLGMLALPDVKMLNELAKLVIKSAQKVIDPPLQVPDNAFLVGIKTVPGSLNFYRAGTRSQDRIAPIETKGQVEIGVEMLNALRAQITRTFYVDFMLLAQDPNKPSSSGKGITAEYVIDQRDRHMRLLSPMLARLQSEFLDPLINRTFAILWRQSVAKRFGPGSPFAPPPPEISGLNFHIQYVSPIAIAQKSSELDAIGRLIQQQQQLRLLDPQGDIIIDTEAIMRLTASDLNAPAIALKSPDRLQAETQAKADMMAKQQKLEALQGVAGAAKDGGAAIASLADAHATAKGAGGMMGGGVNEAMQEAA